MTFKEKIEKWRQTAGLQHSALDELLDRCEPTTDRYEHDTGDDGIERIAASLGIDEYNLIQPRLDSIEGVTQAFFFIEDRYGLYPVKVGEIIMLCFGDEHYINDFLDDWLYAHDCYVDGVAPRQDYDEWRASYI